MATLAKWQCGRYVFEDVNKRRCRLPQHQGLPWTSGRGKRKGIVPSSPDQLARELEDLMDAPPCLDEPRLVGLVRNPATTGQAWAAEAACHDLATDAFYPEDDLPPPVDLLEHCATCPVALECLATALIHESVDEYRAGWWGGMGPGERELLWADLDFSTPPPVDLELRDPVTIARYLRRQQRTIPSIAVELGCSERTVYRYLTADAA